jgi:hypothetical protein
VFNIAGVGVEDEKMTLFQVVNAALCGVGIGVILYLLGRFGDD